MRGRCWEVLWGPRSGGPSVSPSLCLPLRGKMIPEELEKEIQRVKAEVGRACTRHVPKALQTPQCLPSIPNGLPSVPKAPLKSMCPPLSSQCLSNVPKALPMSTNPLMSHQCLPKSPQCPPKYPETPPVPSTPLSLQPSNAPNVPCPPQASYPPLKSPVCPKVL